MVSQSSNGAKPGLPDGLSIVVAERDDLVPLKPIWLEFVEYHRQLDPRFKVTPEEWSPILENFVRSLREDKSILFVARVHNQLVGYIYGFVFHNNPGYYPKQVGFIRDICVLQAFRRRGVAKQLVETIEDWFRKRQIQVIQLYAAYQNQPGLTAWRNLGYDNYVVGLWKELENPLEGV